MLTLPKTFTDNVKFTIFMIFVIYISLHLIVKLYEPSDVQKMAYQKLVKDSYVEEICLKSVLYYSRYKELVIAQNLKGENIACKGNTK